MQRGIHLLRHGSLPVVVAGVLLPWLDVAGRGRSGLESAELLVTLADLGVRGGVRWLGVIWYLAAAAVLLGWGAATLTARCSRLALAALVGGALGWGVFAVVGGLHDSLRLAASGPAVSLIGCTGLVVAEVLGFTTDRGGRP